MKDNDNWKFAALVRPSGDQLVDIDYLGANLVTKVSINSVDWTRANKWRWSEGIPAAPLEEKSWTKFIPGDKQPEPWEFVDVKFLNGNEGTALHVGTINWETVARYRLTDLQPAPPVMQPPIPTEDDHWKLSDVAKNWVESPSMESSTGTTIDPNSRYYDAGGIETIDIIKAKLTDEQLKGYLLGNVIKYSSRLNFKGSAVRDAEKLKFYSGWLEQLK